MLIVCQVLNWSVGIMRVLLELVPAFLNLLCALIPIFLSSTFEVELYEIAGFSAN